MRLRRVFLLLLAMPFASLSHGASGPSVFHGFVGDQTWFSLISGDGRTLVGQERVDKTNLPTEERGVVRRWTGSDWDRAYFETDFGLRILPRAVSSDGGVIAGCAATYPVTFRAAVWQLGDDGWQRTDLAPESPASDVLGVSANGELVVGWVDLGIGPGYQPTVWEFIEGSWSQAALPKPDPGEIARVTDLSADGRVLVGISYTGSRSNRQRNLVWRREDSGWSVSFLPIDDSIAAGSRIADLSGDGRSIVGHMLQRTTGYSVGRFVWAWEEDAWQWTRLPELVREGGADPWEISDDGDTILGTVDWSAEQTSVRGAWMKTDRGEWRLRFAGSRQDTSDFPWGLTGDGKLALAQPAWRGLRLWNLVNGKLLSMPALVEGLDLNDDAAGWDFSQGELQWLAYHPTDNTYTILGVGHKDGIATTCAISLYAPFLTGEEPTIGGWVDAELPDMGDKGYRVGVLPPGLAYEPQTKRISGRVTQTGTFKVRYRDLTSGRAKEVLLRVVPFAPEQRGLRTITLAASPGASAPGQIRLKIGKTGGVTGHLVWPKGTRLSFSGVLVPDEESDLFVLRAKRRSPEPGRVLRRGKGLDAVQYRVELQMNKVGEVSVQLLDAAGLLLASGESSGA